MDETNNNEQPPKEFNSRLEAMQKRLYRGGEENEGAGLKSTLLSSRPSVVKQNWDTSATEETPIKKEKITKTFLFKLFILSVVFFLIAVGVAGYIYFYGFNIISGDKIEIKVQGPQMLNAGDELSLKVSVANKNQVPLSDVTVIFTYPPQTLSALDHESSFPVDQQEINTINSDQVANAMSRAVIFGEQNSKQTVKINLEYRLPDSNALFTKEETFEFSIGRSPLEITLKAPDNVNAGSGFPIVISIFSNSQTVLKDVNLSVEFPNGFVLKEADPPASPAGNVWELGDIPAGGERLISLTGLVEGQNNEMKSFRARVVSLGADREIEYGSSFHTLTISRPFVDVVFKINGSDRSEIVARAGGKISASIIWRNNLPDKIIDGKFIAKIDGATVDKYSIVVEDGGFYKSSDGTITWDKISTPSLAEISSGGGDATDFHFQILPVIDSSGRIIANPTINLSLLFSGRRVAADNSVQDITSRLDRLVKIESMVDFLARSSHEVGAFQNVGPVPPRVDEETSYTVTWSVSNTANSLGGARIRTKLPVYVKWMGNFSPVSEKIIYDRSTNEVVWELGNVEAGENIASAIREAAFQVSITPSLGQLGQAVTLTESADFVAIDRFTNTTIKKNSAALTTKLLNEPNFRYGDEIVGK